MLVTGPTGSGKTTTLYAALSRLPRGSDEHDDRRGPDRVRARRRRPDAGQRRASSSTFARALRAILRQDPDVIMIGEIRDLETAQIAVQASLTGHLVLATLHTNDAASAVTRLADMGVEPFLLASSLLGVLAQRLVRTLCPAVPRRAPTQRRRGAGCWTTSGLPRRSAAWRAPGCAQCNQTRLSRPHRHLRAAAWSTSDAPPDPRRRGRDRRCATRRCAPACDACARDGARWIADGTHVARGADARDARQ